MMFSCVSIIKNKAVAPVVCRFGRLNDQSVSTSVAELAEATFLKYEISVFHIILQRNGIFCNFEMVLNQEYLWYINSG